jgi:sugar phosphate isomerase/epimerase
VKLGFCSNAYTRFTLEEAIDHVAAMGYAGIEILCDQPHYWPESESADRAAALAAQLSRVGLAAANVNANTAIGAYGASIPENLFGPSLASPDRRIRNRRIQHAKDAIDLAAVVGAPAVSVTGGYCESDHPPESALSLLRQSLREILGHAEARGIHVGIEFEPGLLLETSHEVSDLLEDLGHPLLGFNLDVGHAVVAGEDPAALIRRHADRLWHLHLEDIAGGKHFHRIPGEGDVDFEAIATALREVGYQGFASVEVYSHKRDPDAAARAAYQALAPVFS